MEETFRIEAIKGWEREKIFLTTKVWRNHLKFKDLIEAAKRSLKST